MMQKVFCQSGKKHDVIKFDGQGNHDWNLSSRHVMHSEEEKRTNERLDWKKDFQRFLNWKGEKPAAYSSLVISHPKWSRPP